MASKTVPTAIREREAEVLKKLYEEKTTLTHKAFAKEFGFSAASMVWQYLNNHRPLNLTAASNFASGLQVQISDFSPRLAKQAKIAAAGLADASGQEPTAGSSATAGVGEIAVALTQAVEHLSLARRQSIASALTAMLVNGPSDDQRDVIDTLSHGISIDTATSSRTTWHEAALGVAADHPDIDMRPAYTQFVRDVARYMTEVCGITPQKASAPALVSE